MIGTILTGFIAVAILISIVVALGYLKPEHHEPSPDREIPEGCRNCSSSKQCY